MGSTSSHFAWIVAAAICGLLFLIFDAARYFAQQLGPVRLRKLAGDEEEKSERWTRFDFDNFQLVSGSLLQIALIVAVASTAIAFDGNRTVVSDTLLSVAVWLPIVIVWKFGLALVPESAAETILRGIIPISHLFYVLFWPALYPMRRLAARREAVAEEDEEGEEPTDAEVQAYIDVGEEEGILEPAEGRMLQSIVDFGDRVAREIMTPRIDVQGFEANKSTEELARLFSESKYARIPIYRDSIDQITGIVHIKDLFEAILRGEKKSAAELARPPYVVSETKSVSDLLREFQTEHIQIAIVVDEYGGTAGLVTLEDIVEEIVGEIADEHEEEEPTIVQIADAEFLVSGLLRVEMLEERLATDLRDENYETVAGLIVTTLGRIPNAGTSVTKNGWKFTVDRADKKRIYRVKVTRDPEWREEGEDEE